MLEKQSTTDQHGQATRLNPLALAFGFGAAGIIEIFLIGAMGLMGGGGWMHGSAGGGFGNGGGMMGGGPGYGGGSMMGGGFGLYLYTLIWGFFGGAIAGGVIALVYNAVSARNVSTARL